MKDGRVGDETRLRAALPTLNALRERGAKIVVLSHLGRPDGKPNPKYSLRPIAARLADVPPGGSTLDGLTFLSPDDRAAVRWLSDQNGASSDRVVIAESCCDEYSSDAFLATYSGSVAVLGWAGHELQWRGSLPEIGNRQSQLSALYRDAPLDQVRSILDRYVLDSVAVGDAERKHYGDEVTARFDALLPVAFHSGSDVIYRAR